MNKKFKLIVFDSWTQGSHHLDILAKTLREAGFKLILVHIGSWGHDKHAGSFKKNYYKVNDINHYNITWDLETIILNEKPDAVLFFSTRSLGHQAFNMLLKHHDIPTFHLYHGITSVRDTSLSGRDTIPVINHVNSIIEAISRNLIYVIPAYFISCLKTKNVFRGVKNILTEIFLKVCMATQNTRAPEFCATDYGCVYVPLDAEHMVRTYRIPNDCVSVVGCPDLIELEHITGRGFAVEEFTRRKKNSYLYRNGCCWIQ